MAQWLARNLRALSKTDNRALLKSAPATFVQNVIATYMLVAAGNGFALENRAPSELAWFKSIDAQINSLVSRPKECLKSPLSLDVRLGRLAFKSPRLLGGQAGRMGLSCDSCHRSGRGNQDFFIEQLSDRPGAADISHHFLSSAGGDQVFNPKPIPDLADRLTLNVQDNDSHAFSEMLIRLIEIEFDGQTANERIFESIRSYLRANDIQHCAQPYADEPRSLNSDWLVIKDGLNILQTLAPDKSASNHSATVKFVASSLRAQLENFYRLYSLQPNQELDDELKSLSSILRRSFLASEDTLKTKPPEAKLKLLLPRFAALKLQLQRLESSSYYNQKLARQALMKH